MSMDGLTYVEGILENIQFLLILQLVTSGVPNKDIAKALDYELKDFNRLFPWTKKIK